MNTTKNESITVTEQGRRINADGYDVTEVFAVSENAPTVHRVNGGCTDESNAQIYFDLFAAKEMGYRLCSRCFDTETDD